MFRTGAANSPAVPRSSLPARRKARAGHGGLAPPARRAGRDAGRRVRGLEGGKAAAARHPQAAAARRQGTHRLGDAGPAEGRPHRLPLADPPLRRSQRGVPVCRAVRSGRRGRAFQRGAVRHRERVLEPPRRALHLRRDDRGVRNCHATAAAARHAGARRRHRAARPRAGSARPARGLARAVADVRRRS